MRPSCRTITATLGASSWREYSAAVTSDAVIASLLVPELTRAVPGAIAVGSPMSVLDPELPLIVTLARPAREASADTLPRSWPVAVPPTARAIVWASPRAARLSL